MNIRLKLIHLSKYWLVIKEVSAESVYLLNFIQFSSSRLWTLHFKSKYIYTCTAHTLQVNWFRQCRTCCSIIRFVAVTPSLINTLFRHCYLLQLPNKRQRKTHQDTFKLWMDREGKKSSAILNKLNDHVTRATAVNSNNIMTQTKWYTCVNTSVSL